MIVAAEYSFNGGEEKIKNEYPDYYQEIVHAINSVDASICKNKRSKEITMPGRILFSPVALNAEFKKHFSPMGWKNYKVPCDYSNDYYVNGYSPESVGRSAYRDMDFVKNEVGVEVQFGKYAFMGAIVKCGV